MRRAVAHCACGWGGCRARWRVPTWRAARAGTNQGQRLAHTHGSRPRPAKDKNKPHALYVPMVECISKARLNALRVRREGEHCDDLEGRPGGGHAEPAGQSTRRPHAGRDSLTSEHPCRVQAHHGDRGQGLQGRTNRRGRTSCARARTGASPERSERRHRAIEPAIEHMKMDGRLWCNPLKGALDDALHAVMCGVGRNPRLILAKLRLLCEVRMAPQAPTSRQQPACAAPFPQPLFQ